MSNCKSHFVLTWRDRIIMPKEITVSARSIAIPRDVLTTPYGMWFPLSLLGCDLYGIINNRLYTPAVMRNLDGVLIAKNGEVYSIQYSTDQFSLPVIDCYQLQWDRKTGFYVIPSKRGFDDVIHTLSAIDPDMSPHQMCDIAAQIVLVRAGERYDECISEVAEKLKNDDNILPVKELFKDINEMNRSFRRHHQSTSVGEP